MRDELLRVREKSKVEFIQTDLFSMVNEMLNSRILNFVLYQTDGRPELSEAPENMTGPLMGYNRKYLLPTISDPTEFVTGAVVIIGQNLIYSPYVKPLHKQDNAYVWAHSKDEFYTSKSFEEALKEFLEAEYSLFITENVPIKPSDIAELGTLNEITLDDIFLRG